MEDLVSQVMPKLRHCTMHKKSEMKKFNDVSDDKFIGSSFYLHKSELTGSKAKIDETKTLYSIPTVAAAIKGVIQKLI